MRLCRIELDGRPQPALFEGRSVIPLPAAAEAWSRDQRGTPAPPESDDLLSLLPHGEHAAAAAQLAEWAAGAAQLDDARLPLEQARLLTPIPRPRKLLLLAGNYAQHIEEGGEMAAERAETFPYVFMKPPTTTLTHPGDPVRIPRVSPGAIDWELELVVVIGRKGKSIPEAEALDYVAGYTVANDISNRKFRPSPRRKERSRDRFFDWLHGKWHDSFFPCGPCVASADAVADPQRLSMQLRVNGEVKQSASTAQQIFPVAAVIEFISNIMTLEPGDLISTGTAAGVGNTTGQYLQPGDEIEAEIESIGLLRTPVAAE